jgi:hypothetical protein
MAPGLNPRPEDMPTLMVMCRRRQRHDWVRGDVRCLMCGRLLGRLLGTTRANESGDRPTGHPVAFLAYRPLDPTKNILPYTRGLRFRCGTCGGAGALDEIDVFSTYDEVPTADGEDEELELHKHGRGRRARPFPPPRVVGLETVLDDL